MRQLEVTGNRNIWKKFSNTRKCKFLHKIQERVTETKKKNMRQLQVGETKKYTDKFFKT